MRWAANQQLAVVMVGQGHQFTLAEQTPYFVGVNISVLELVGMSSRLPLARSSLMTRRAVGSRLCASHQSIGFFSHSRLPKAIAAALSNPSSFSSHISVALEFDAIS